VQFKQKDQTPLNNIAEAKTLSIANVIFLAPDLYTLFPGPDRFSDFGFFSKKVFHDTLYHYGHVPFLLCNHPACTALVRMQNSCLVQIKATGKQVQILKISYFLWSWKS
jgi:hypothetical protein